MTTDELRATLLGLSSSAGDVTTDGAGDTAARVDRLRLLEQIKAAAAAAQAAEAAALLRQRRREHAAAGLPPERQGAGVAGEVALAMRMSPARAQRWLGWATIVTSELPATFAELRAGRNTEWRTMLVARETAFLSREDRAYRLDPAGAVDRSRRAASDRHVSIRPAPDTMCRLSALLPVAEGVATYAALRAAADAATGTADGAVRSRGQIMADTLVDRVTGRATTGAVPVEINLIMTDQTLFDRGTHRREPAVLAGHGPLPAALAPRLARAGDAPRWIRRLYTDPVTGALREVDARRRRFTPAQRRFLDLRDQTCRTPWCDAPIRHHDHVRRHADGGPTAIDNGQGLSERCNHANEAPGWSTRAGPDGTITVTTPSGHSYVGRPPPLPAAPPSRGSVEYVFAASHAA